MVRQRFYANVCGLVLQEKYQVLHILEHSHTHTMEEIVELMAKAANAEDIRSVGHNVQCY